jgi:urease accessory protein UreE
MDFCWKIRRVLDKSKLLTSSRARNESVTLKSLERNKEIRIVQADKGNSTVALNEATHKEKIPSLLESAVQEHLSKDPTYQTEKIRRLP